VSGDPKGSAEVGLERWASRSWEEAAMTALSMSCMKRPDAEGLIMEEAMSSILRGRSSRNLSMAQS